MVPKSPELGVGRLQQEQQRRSGVALSELLWQRSCKALEDLLEIEGMRTKALRIGEVKLQIGGPTVDTAPRTCTPARSRDSGR